MIARFTRWLMDRVFRSKFRESIEPIIRRLYRKMATEDLIIKAEVVRVKKGKRRYDLVFYETPAGILRANLSRHWNNSHMYLQKQHVRAK